MGLNPYDTPRGRLHRLAEISRRQFLLLMGVLAALAAPSSAGSRPSGLFPNANLEEPLGFTVDADPRDHRRQPAADHEKR